MAKIIPSAFRLRAWYDTSDLSRPELPDPKWGIEARVAPRKWAHCAKDDKLLLFDTVEEADAEMQNAKTRAAALQAGAQDDR